MHRDLDERRAITISVFNNAPLTAACLLGPPLHPSTAPFALLSCSIAHLYRQKKVTQKTNVVAYINSLVVYATVASQYILDPNDDPCNHLVQLQDLGERAAEEARRVKHQGTGVPTSDDPADWTEDHVWLTPVDWSLVMFQSKLRSHIETEGQTYPHLR